MRRIRATTSNKAHRHQALPLIGMHPVFHFAQAPGQLAVEIAGGTALGAGLPAQARLAAAAVLVSVR